jgi:hypothetical protein
MVMNVISWSQLFGGYAQWRLPEFPLATQIVLEEDYDNEYLVEALADRIGIFYSQNPAKLGFLFTHALKVDSLEDLEFPNPVANMLLREGFFHISELTELSTVDYLNFRGVGQGSYLGLLKTLVRMNLRMSSETYLETDFELAQPAQVEDSSSDSLDFYDFYSHILLAANVAPGSVYEKVLEAALFANFVGGAEQSVLKLDTKILSSESSHLDAEFGSISAVSLLGGVEAPTFKEVALDFVSALDEKDRSVLLNRFLAEEKQTLDEVGVGLGVSRERIRQIAKKLQDRFAEKASQEQIFKAAVSAFRHLTSDPITVAHLQEKQSELFSKLGEFDSTAFHFFSGMGAVMVDAGWIYKAKEEQLKQFADAWKLATDGAKYTTLDQLLRHLSDYWPSFTEAKLADWLEDNGYVSYQGFYYFSKGASLVTVAKIVLEVEQKPMTFKALFEAIPDGTSERAIRNRLLQDPDVVKSGKESCALKVWGVAEFTTIHQELEALVRAEGSQSLDGTIRRFVEQFGVAESAVRAYANAHPLQVIGGQIRLSEGRIAATPRHRSVKNVYRTSDGWAWRITVNSEHLRGSGSQCPSFLADQLEITGGTVKEYLCAEGRIAFSSSALNQRNIGSIRDVCISVGAKVSDQIVIHFAENTARVTKLDPALKGEPLVRALAVLPPSGELISQLSFALNAETSKSLDELVEIMAKRKEVDLAEAFTSLYHSGF